MREYLAVEMAIALDATEIHAVALSPTEEVPEHKRYGNTFGILEKTIDQFSDDVGLNDIRIPMLINSTLRRLNDAKRKLKEKGVPQATITACFKAGPDDPFQDKEELAIHIIRPEAPLGVGPGGLTFDPTEMQGMVCKGYERAKAYFAVPPPTDPFVVLNIYR
jgi:hypothetical protein